MNEPKSSPRLEGMRGFIEKHPDQAFPRYGLAMEYAKLERFDDAVGEFQELTRRHPAYLATYYQLGSLLVKLGRRDEAREVYRRGIEVSQEQNELHAQSELEEALAALG